MASSRGSPPIVLAAGGRGHVVSSSDGIMFINAKATGLTNVISATVFEDKGETYVGAIFVSKSVHILRLDEKDDPLQVSWRQVAKHELPKRPSSICFSSKPRSVLVADTTGDVFKLPLDGDRDLKSEEAQENHLLLGHFSLLTDLSVRGQYLATCDRDNRVRVSRFPDAFIIEAFFLRHKDFVSCVEWVTDTRLLSAGADGRLMLWDIEKQGEEPLSAIEFDSGDFPEDPIITCIDVHPLDRDCAIVVFDYIPVIHVVSGMARGNVIVKAGDSGNFFNNNVSVTNAHFDGEGVLWVSTSCNGGASIQGLGLSCTKGNVNFEKKKSIENINPDPLHVPYGTSKSTAAERQDSREYIRTAWLKQLRKKPIVEDWKGKKRKAATLT